jgi:hypothetical protein
MSDKQIPHQRGSADGSGGTAKSTAKRGTVRRRRPAPPPEPLGSIATVAGYPSETPQTCPDCGGGDLTRVEMVLTDTTPVVFISCHDCERRAWFTGIEELSIEAVLERSAKR